MSTNRFVFPVVMEILARPKKDTTMTTQEEWWLINNIEELDSPALVIFPERVKENIRILISMVDSVDRLRPHAKTHKSIECTRLLMEAGIHKFKCATIAEAEMLALSKAKDVLLAYQPVGPKLRRFVSLIKKYQETKFSCLTDNWEAATQMAKLFAGNGLTIEVYLDLNTGQNRTGIVPGDSAVQLYLDCSLLKGLKPVGLHSYDGHIRDLDINIRKQRCDEAFAEVEKMQNVLQQKGFADPIIIAGGSPTFSIHSKRKKIECSPGTFIFWDKNYSDLCPEQPFLPAALVISRVISIQEEGKLCLDLGHKAVAAENELTKRVWFLNAPEWKAVGQSEEHLVVETNSGQLSKIGDVKYGLPFHICPTVALYERAYTVTNHIVKGEWNIIARDRKINL